MPRHEISNDDDVIDSRDVIARIKELESAIEDSLGEHADDAPTDAPAGVLADWWKEHGADSDEVDELLALRALAEEAKGEHGESMIRESYFVEYCQELCADIGDLPRDLPRYLVIDWEATARNLRQDYTEVDYAGVTYLIR